MGAGTHDESYIDSTKDVAAFTPLAARPMLDVATLAPLAAIVETASATESDASPKAFLNVSGAGSVGNMLVKLFDAGSVGNMLVKLDIPYEKKDVCDSFLQREASLVSTLGLVEVSTLDMLEDGMGSIELTDESLAHFEGKSVMFEV